MRISRVLIYLVILLLMGSAACKEERKVDVAASLNPDRMATMTTQNVSTLISDSGLVQYKIVAPIWKVYDQVDTPYWIFPQGLYLQKYDRNFKVISTVAADSARYFKDRKLWKLMGRVELTKAPRDLFQSAELYWDQSKSRIYSDSFIHIETATHVLEGIGFVSNDRLTEYRVVKPMGIFPINKENITAGPQDTPSPSSSPQNPPEEGRVTVEAVAADSI